jgi:hypothetical protein
MYVCMYVCMHLYSKACSVTIVAVIFCIRCIQYIHPCQLQLFMVFRYGIAVNTYIHTYIYIDTLWNEFSYALSS